MNEDDRRGFHFSKTFTIGEIVSAFTLGFFMWQVSTSFVNEMRVANAAMDKRISILEEKASMQQRVDERQDANFKEGQARIEASLAEIQHYLRERTAPTGTKLLQ